MSKEMIVSVNGREKKIAILDNGKVTEFYIERGEENSGVVGNVYKGRVMLAIEKYKNGEASLGKAAELAGLSVGDMMTTLEQYGVKSNLEVEDYLEGLDNLKKAW